MFEYDLVFGTEYSNNDEFIKLLNEKSKDGWEYVERTANVYCGIASIEILFKRVKS